MKRAPLVQRVSNIAAIGRIASKHFVKLTQHQQTNTQQPNNNHQKQQINHHHPKSAPPSPQIITTNKTIINNSISSKRKSSSAKEAKEARENSNIIDPITNNFDNLSLTKDGGVAGGGGNITPTKKGANPPGKVVQKEITFGFTQKTPPQSGPPEMNHVTGYEKRQSDVVLPAIHANEVEEMDTHEGKFLSFVFLGECFLISCKGVTADCQMSITKNCVMVIYLFFFLFFALLLYSFV